MRPHKMEGEGRFGGSDGGDRALWSCWQAPTRTEGRRAWQQIKSPPGRGWGEPGEPGEPAIPLYPRHCLLQPRPSLVAGLLVGLDRIRRVLSRPHEAVPCPLVGRRLELLAGG